MHSTSVFFTANFTSYRDLKGVDGNVTSLLHGTVFPHPNSARASKEDQHDADQLFAYWLAKGARCVCIPGEEAFQRYLLKVSGGMYKPTGRDSIYENISVLFCCCM